MTVVLVDFGFSFLFGGLQAAVFFWILQSSSKACMERVESLGLRVPLPLAIAMTIAVYLVTATIPSPYHHHYRHRQHHHIIIIIIVVVSSSSSALLSSPSSCLHLISLSPCAGRFSSRLSSQGGDGSCESTRRWDSVSSGRWATRNITPDKPKHTWQPCKIITIIRNYHISWFQ